MAPLHLGDNKIANLYYGDTKWSKAYLGDNLVYSGEQFTYSASRSTADDISLTGRPSGNSFWSKALAFHNGSIYTTGYTGSGTAKRIRIYRFNMSGAYQERIDPEILTSDFTCEGLAVNDNYIWFEDRSELYRMPITGFDAQLFVSDIGTTGLTWTGDRLLRLTSHGQLFYYTQGGSYLGGADTPSEITSTSQFGITTNRDGRLYYLAGTNVFAFDGPPLSPVVNYSFGVGGNYQGIEYHDSVIYVMQSTSYLKAYREVATLVE